MRPTTSSQSMRISVGAVSGSTGFWRGAVGIFCWALLALTVNAAAVVVSGNSSVNMTKDDGPRNVTLGFFDEANGGRVARLQIGLMTLDYRRQGLFRVAWKPQVVLTNVTLQLTDLAACRRVGEQLPEALRSIGAGGAVQLRAFVLEVQQPSLIRIEARGAEITADGNLLLLAATRGDDTAGASRNILVRLTGANAGLLENQPRSAPVELAPTQSVTLAHP